MVNSSGWGHNDDVLQIPTLQCFIITLLLPCHILVSPQVLYCNPQSISTYTFGRIAASIARRVYVLIFNIVRRADDTYPGRLKKQLHQPLAWSLLYRIEQVSIKRQISSCYPQRIEHHTVHLMMAMYVYENDE